MSRASFIIAVLGLLMTAPVAGQLQQREDSAAGVDERASAIAKPVLDRLDAAWNAADGAAFAAEFTEDADLINIFGQYYQGRAAVAERMQLIFDGIFKGSSHLRRDLEIACFLRDDTVLIVSSAHVGIPQGALAPETANRQTFILTRNDGQGLIKHWHNTTIRADPE